jgi:hypothetical protein
MLGAKPIEFIPLLFFPMLVIAFNLFYAISGLTITGLDKDITLDNVNLDSPSLKT